MIYFPRNRRKSSPVNYFSQKVSAALLQLSLSGGLWVEPRSLGAVPPGPGVSLITCVCVLSAARRLALLCWRNVCLCANVTLKKKNGTFSFSPPREAPPNLPVSLIISHCVVGLGLADRGEKKVDALGTGNRCRLCTSLLG